MGYLLQHLFVLFLVAIPFFLVFWMLPLWFICKKAGFSPWITLLNCIPLGNTVLLYLLAFADWKRHPMFVAEPMPPLAAAQSPAQPSAQKSGPQIVARRI
ncbi:MAG TPA: hypothetical protein VG225_01260 [Terracidiphilus sp.]|jgi:hypothetical protein|nr:hypothetical protein [Terracidiphilus sp.]